MFPKKITLNINLNTHIKKGSKLVTTQIPDKRSEKLYILNKFTLLPNIKSVLYADKNKLVLANYSIKGEYIDHRIVAAISKNDQDHPVYSIVDTKENTIIIYSYNNFSSNYEETLIQIHQNGYFQDLIPIADMALNASSQIALIGCNNYGLNDLYPINEKWLLVSTYNQTAKSVTSLRYGYDFVGRLITLIDEPYEYPKNDTPYIFAFKGNYIPTDVQFYKSQSMTLQELNELNKQLQNTQWVAMNNKEKNVKTISRTRARIHKFNEQFQLIYLQEHDFGGSLIIKNKNKITSVTYVIRYDVFKIKNKLYLVTSLPSESSTYVVYEIINNRLKKLEEFSIACC